MTTYLFPGQGSQQKGMGEGLFEAFPELTAAADELLGYSIRALCLEDAQGQLNQTQYTQPALYVVNALAYRQKLQQTGMRPDFVAGHSLGEYNALQASGALSFVDGLQLVQKRGELMSQAAEGAMAAILNVTVDTVNEVLGKQELSGIDIANDNSPTQIVISGPSVDLERAQAVFEEAGALFIPLKTSGAFHSRYMAEAKAAFADYLQGFGSDGFQFDDLEIPVIANVNAQPYQLDQLANNLMEQITCPVQWTQSMRYLLAQGETQFEELGPGNVLTKLLSTIQQNTPTEDRSVQGDSVQNSVEDSLVQDSSTQNTPPEDSPPKNSPVAPSADTPHDSEAPTLKSDSSSEISDLNTTMPIEPTVPTDITSTSSPKELSPSNLDMPTEAAYAEKINTVQKSIAEWNRIHSVGSSVLVDGYDDPLETRTQAMLLFGHRAAIYLKGYEGYFHLNDVSPVSAEALGAEP